MAIIAPKIVEFNIHQVVRIFHVKKSDVQIFKDGIFINLTLVIMKIIFDKKTRERIQKEAKTESHALAKPG